MSINYITILLIIGVILASIVIILLLNRVIGRISSAICGFITKKLGKSWQDTEKEQKKSPITAFLVALLTLCISLQPLLICIGDTLVNRTFVEEEVGNLDVNEAIMELWLDPLSQYYEYTSVALEETLTAHADLVEAEVIGTIDSFFDYIENGVALEIDISLSELKADFAQNLIAAVENDPPSELANASVAELEAYADTIYESVLGNMDDTYVLSATNAAVIRVINVIYTIYQTARSWLISVTIALALLIILLDRKIYPALIDVGSALFIASPLGLAYGYILTYVTSTAIDNLTLGTTQIWLIEVVRDAWSVANAPIYILCAFGILLMVIAVILPQKKQKEVLVTEKVSSD